MKGKDYLWTTWLSTLEIQNNNNEKLLECSKEKSIIKLAYTH